MVLSAVAPAFECDNLAKPCYDYVRYSIAGDASTLTLYQLDCGCADDIPIVKSRTANELALY